MKVHDNSRSRVAILLKSLIEANDRFNIRKWWSRKYQLFHSFNNSYKTIVHYTLNLNTFVLMKILPFGWRLTFGTYSTYLVVTVDRPTHESWVFKAEVFPLHAIDTHAKHLKPPRALGLPPPMLTLSTEEILIPHRSLQDWITRILGRWRPTRPLTWGTLFLVTALCWVFSLFEETGKKWGSKTSDKSFGELNKKFVAKFVTRWELISTYHHYS